MPDKQLTIATYAAGASLAAITLVYVFAPTFFIDAEAESNANSRKRGVVGLVNPANDCFINSTVQALAGLGDLRLYLIRETHRRKLDGPAVYRSLVEDPSGKETAPWKIEGLQEGIITQGLKELLDGLNERPIYKKTISVAPFVKCLEAAFRQRISRQQQDAQEFLQIVAERLGDEYHAGQRARRRAKELGENPELQRELIRLSIEASAKVDSKPDEQRIEHRAETDGASLRAGVASSSTSVKDSHIDGEDDEEGFPLEGSFESQIECLTCGFKPAANRSTFCSLTLNVPALPSTTLNACFDGIFKTEYIEDFKCEKCRLIHALEILQKDLAKSSDPKHISKIESSIAKIEGALATDAEHPPADLELPDARFAPKRKIARHIKITSFPKVLSIHLSRSIFDNRSSLKNAAKVAFPETLPLGSLLDRQTYKLQSVVMHKGSHHSGHYETFRRQNIHMPFVNEHPFAPGGPYSRVSTPGASVAATPQLKAVKEHDESLSSNAKLLETPESLSPRADNASRISLPESLPPSAPFTTEGLEDGASLPTTPPRSATPSLRSVTRSSLSKISNLSRLRNRSRSPTKEPASPSQSQSPTETAASSSVAISAPPEEKRGLRGMQAQRRHRKASERWWRISDDKIKESKTSDVLGMQREVYLLFYELVR